VGRTLPPPAPVPAHQFQSRIEERDRRRLLMQMKAAAGVEAVPLTLSEVEEAVRTYVKQRLRAPMMMGVPTRGVVQHMWLDNVWQKYWPYITMADTIRTQAGPDIGGQRNSLVRYFLRNTEAEWLLQVDDDVVYVGDGDPFVGMQQLANEEGADIITGVCPLSKYPHNPNVYLYTRSDASLGLPDAKGVHRTPDGTEVDPSRSGRFMPISEFTTNSVMKVDGCGGAFLMVRRSLYEQMPEPWFAWAEGMGEDLYFAHKARQAGHTILADFRIKLGHIKPVPMTLEMYVGHRAAEGLYGELKARMAEVTDTMAYNVEQGQLAPHLMQAVGSEETRPRSVMHTLDAKGELVPFGGGN